MKKLLLLILLLLSIPLTAQELKVGQTYKATLAKCVDGDTANFLIAGQKERVRFLFIDTPESTNKIQPLGKEAASYTCNALQKATRIELETDGPTLKDRYNRLLAWVWVDNQLLQEELAKAGLVQGFYDYGTYKYENRVRQAMPNAQPIKAQSTANQPIKKSSSGICHAPDSSLYSRTTSYTPYRTIDDCLASGGRLPKR